MSVSQEVERLQFAANRIRSKLQSLGVAESGDNLTTMATNIQVLEKPTGNRGQYVGFILDNVIGAVDPPNPPDVPLGYRLVPFTVTNEGVSAVYNVLCANELNPGILDGYELIPFKIDDGTGTEVTYRVLAKKVVGGN